MITIDDVLKGRKKLRNKHRKIFNEDGAAATRYDRDFGYPLTADIWLGHRFGPFVGHGNHIVENPVPSQVTTFVFNTDFSGYVLRKSEVEGVVNGRGLADDNNIPITRYGDITQHLIDVTGRDPLQVVGDFFADKEVEFFYGVRVNDRHDATYPRNQLTPAKQALWDSGDLLSNGVNNALDYASAKARKLMTDTILEVINDDKYKIDGICIDFNRHLGLFKNVVAGSANHSPTTQEQIDIVTDWLYEINDALNTKSIERMQKGLNPLLMMLKTPDDASYAKLCALDINKWMRDGVVDILVPINYHQFNLLQDMVIWGKKYGVAVCPSVQDVRDAELNGRYDKEGFIGRYCQVLGASPDGVEFFNYNYVVDLSYASPSGEFWRNMKYEEVINISPRAYYATWTHQGGDFLGTASYLPARTYYSAKYPLLSSVYPCNKPAGVFLVEVYEKEDKISTVDIKLYTDASGSTPIVELNGKSVGTLTPVTDGFQSEFDKSLLRHGVNVVAVRSLSSPLTDLKIRVRS